VREMSCMQRKGKGFHLMIYFNGSGFNLGFYAGKYPGRIGYLFNPARSNKYPPPVPLAFDNGAFACWGKGVEYDIEPFWAQLERLKKSGRKAEWIIVPDVVADAERTLENWERYADRVSTYGPPAIAVQDGMEPSDVPSNAKVVFVGGTTEWKWRNAERFCGTYRTHIGRVNTKKRLMAAERVGAESVDGTGWFRGGVERLEQLDAYLSGAYHNQWNLTL